MIPARQVSAAATAWLVAGACLAALLAAAPARAQGAACAEADVAVLPSPVGPWKGAPLRVIVASDKPADGELTLVAPNGSVAAKVGRQYDGPPSVWIAEVAAPAAGTWGVMLARAGACGTITRQIAVADKKPATPQATGASLWPIRAAWNRANENLYAAWIEKLFDAPLDAEPSWKALHEVLRDKSRNMLFDHLGLREDEIGLVYRPDCADLPYFLRAYFSFKMGLPFGYAKCTRGDAGSPPRCFAWWNIINREPPPRPNAPDEGDVAAAPPPVTTGGTQYGLFQRSASVQASMPVTAPPPRPQKQLGLVPGFAQYVTRAVADGVHSGTDRTPLADENTDVYPVALNQDALRPGTLYADPYGHVLVLVKRVPQTAEAAGLFFAVDAQPDATVARKRYWRGNFLFAQDPRLGGPGFKRFRPIERSRDGGGLRRETNEEIARNPEYGDFSLEQAKFAVDEFYDRMDDVMSPAPLDPVVALKDAISSLEEQVKTRVISVENGRKFLNSGKGDASMPDGAAIFETSGAWEDFATPARDLRLLIAMDVVRTYPERVERRPNRYAMPPGKSPADVKAELKRVLATELAARKFSYARTDGSQWTLALKDVMDRMGDLEMAYNLNDCVELRWGAPQGSAEASTCKRHAPQAQRSKMSDYRSWFHDRRRPPRA